MTVTPDAVLKDTKHRDCRPGEACRVIPVPTHPCKGKCSCDPGALYLRVSKIMKREELLSPELQAHDGEAFCNRSKIRVVKIICDINKSGQSFAERRVGEIIDDIEAKAYRQVVMMAWDRWGRNNQESQLYLRLVKDAGGRVRAASEDFDTDTDEGELGVGVMLLLAQYRGRQISKGWKRVHNSRRRDGLPHTARRQFGYTYNGKARKYEANLEEAVILADLYDSFIRGSSMRSLALKLNQANIPTITGVPWQPQTLRRTMDTGFAAGYIRERKNPPKAKPGGPKVGGASTMRAYDIWRKGSHEPLISEETWQTYKAKREATADLAPRLRRATHALSGMLYCGLCHDAGVVTRLVTGYSSKHRKHQWLCPRGRNHEHRYTSISNANAMKLVLEWVEFEAGSAGDVTAMAEKIAQASIARVDAESLRSEVERLTKRRKNINSRLTDADDDDRADLEEQLADVKRDLTEASSALAAAELAAKDDGKALVEAFTTLRQEWDTYQPEEHHEALVQLIAKITVYPGSPGTQTQQMFIEKTYKD